MSFNIIDATDSWMTRPKLSAPRQPHYYPSEASVILKREDGTEYVEGTCLRAAYLRNTGIAEAMPPNARSEWIFAQGKIIESHLVEQWKQMGLWVTNSLKFYWEEYNISGELDCVISEPPNGDLVGIEVKTFYGYDAGKKIMGNKWTAGKPKMSQLLQTLVYTYFFREKLKHFKMIYFARDDVRRREFKIEVKEEAGSWYPAIDGKISREFSMQDVFNRYKLLDQYVQSGVVPPADYQLAWDSARVEAEKVRGNVSKTAYADWQKGKRQIGDWQCSYCQFKNYCWGTTQNDGEDEEAVATDL